MQIKHGQVGLLLLVIMAVVIAVVMAVASRSLSDTVLSRQEKEGNLAFSLAETGVENALKSLREGSVTTGTVSLSDSTGLVTGGYQVEVQTGYTLYLREGEVGELDLTNFAGGNITFSWTKKGDPSEDIGSCSEGSGTMPAALEINAIKNDGTVSRSYYNPSNCTLSGNNFSASVDGGSNYRSQTTYLPVNTAKIRLRTIYAGATVEVAGGGLTDEQMYVIQASAAGGDAQKEIEVRRGLDAPASIFDYTVFSGQTIVK